MPKHRDIAFLKMVFEGAGLSALQGGERILRRLW